MSVKKLFSTVARLTAAAALAGSLAACAKIELPAHLRPISKDSMMLLGKKGMNQHAPIFVRIFKEESELEVWKQRLDGRFYHFKTYPICQWSGALGPKRRQGDKQAPEGFYQVNRHLMNPNSKFHLAFNLGYPNAYDRAHGRTGNFLMVHGKCSSAGCYAMTDGLIEEIYALARESFIGGQQTFTVHAFPFRMTDENLARHKKSKHRRFWQTLKEGYDYFEFTRQVPQVAICNRRYHVNVAWDGQKLDPTGPCPHFTRPAVQPFWPIPGEEQIANQRIIVTGPKKKRLYASRRPLDRSQMYGLTKIPGESPRVPSAAAAKPDPIETLLRLIKDPNDS
ncbi:MAG: L,D-transpeptidase family protein [Hyphomicrobiaceae bacterium]